MHRQNNIEISDCCQMWKTVPCEQNVKWNKSTHARRHFTAKSFHLLRSGKFRWKKALVLYKCFFSGCGTRIWTQTNRVRVCRAAITQFRNVFNWRDILYNNTNGLSRGFHNLLCKCFRHFLRLHRNTVKRVLQDRFYPICTLLPSHGWHTRRRRRRA